MTVTVDCPTCGNKVVWNETSTFRPFCSNRCKQIDLGAWANEAYAIPAVPPADEVDDDSHLQQ